MSGGGPSSPQVIVVGAGIAGTAAAVAASRAGSTVTLLDGGTGASTLWTGALDFDEGPLLEAIPREVFAFLETLRGYALAPGTRLVTTSGVLRAAAGRDAALLDVSATAAERIGVIACDRPGWSARSLASAWGDRFEALEATVLRHTDERVIPDADFAERHDDPARLEWFGTRLAEAVARGGRTFGALVVPPCLGVRESRASELTARVGIPCGEAIGLPGGPAGLRFESARDRVLREARVDHRKARAISVEPSGASWRVTTSEEVLDAAAVVVAAGGLLGGGIAYGPPDGRAFAGAQGPPFPALRTTLACPLDVGVGGRKLEAALSAFGAPPERLLGPAAGQPALERAGVLVDAGGRSPHRGLLAAGDVVADLPRTWLGALARGLRAGTAAAQVVLGPSANGRQRAR